MYGLNPIEEELQNFIIRNPLAELNQCVLDSANGLVIYIIDVL